MLAWSELKFIFFDFESESPNEVIELKLTHWGLVMPYGVVKFG